MDDAEVKHRVVGRLRGLDVRGIAKAQSDTLSPSRLCNAFACQSSRIILWIKVERIDRSARAENQLKYDFAAAKYTPRPQPISRACPADSQKSAIF